MAAAAGELTAWLATAKAGRMRVAADAADLVTRHAQLFPLATMAARAAHGIGAGGPAVSVGGPRRAHPPGWMPRPPRVSTRGYAPLHMALLAPRFSVARHTQRGISPGLKRVSRDEARPVQLCIRDAVEAQHIG